MQCSRYFNYIDCDDSKHRDFLFRLFLPFRATGMASGLYKSAPTITDGFLFRDSAQSGVTLKKKAD